MSNLDKNGDLEKKFKTQKLKKVPMGTGPQMETHVGALHLEKRWRLFITPPAQGSTLVVSLTLIIHFNFNSVI